LEIYVSSISASSLRIKGKETGKRKWVRGAIAISAPKEGAPNTPPKSNLQPSHNQVNPQQAAPGGRM